MTQCHVWVMPQELCPKNHDFVGQLSGDDMTSSSSPLPGLCGRQCLSVKEYLELVKIDL
jgi:hypothetical protein